MNLNEELAMAGELELTDSELETVSGGWEGPGEFRRFDRDDFYPWWFRSVPWWYWYEGYGRFRDQDDFRFREWR